MTEDMTAGAQRRQHGAGREQRQAHTTASGVLLASAAVPVAILRQVAGPIWQASQWLQVATAVVTLLLLLGGLTITRRSRLGQVSATLATLGLFGLGAPILAQFPLFTLAALVAGAASLTLLWEAGAPIISLSVSARRPLYEGQARGAALVALTLWSFWAFADVGETPFDTLVVGLPMIVCLILSVERMVRNWKTRRRLAVVILASIVTAGLFAAPVWGQWWWMMSSLAWVAAPSLLFHRHPHRSEVGQSSWWEPLLGHPERLFVGTFAGLSLCGTVVLALPQSSISGHSIGLVNAAFTSTSAVCVTGLIVLDTPVDFTVFGQAAILVLIQVGGLGIMTFSTTALWALGRRMSMRYEGAVASLISTQDRGRLFATAKQIIQLTIVTEALGAAILTAAFVHHGDRFATALWRGVFTSVSAFCNAGFALQSDSLIAYQHSPSVLHVVGLLIIVGGLSPLVVLAVPTLVRRPSAPIAAQAKMSLTAALILLVAGFLFVLAFEWNDALGSLNLADRIHNAWFQSVTLRTAGFNSIDIALARPSTLTLMMLWMFIGGSPGGTAGGVKTTTVSVLLLSVLHAIRGRPTIEAFRKRISERTRTKAIAVVVVAATTAVIALVAIQLTQPLPTRQAAFEVISALGTVGLSIGGTSGLDGIGKAIIIICMFVGRVGGVTLLMFLGNRRRVSTIARPEEEIDVG